MQQVSLTYTHFTNIERSIQLDKDFTKLYSSLSDSSKSKINPIFNILDEHINYIGSVKDSLFKTTGNSKIDLNIPFYNQLDSFQNLENYNIPTDFFIGEEPGNPHNLKFGAWEIQNKLIELNKNVVSNLQKNGITLSKTQIDIENYNQGQGDYGAIPWAIVKFYQLPLGLIIGNLSEIEVQIRETKIQILELVINN